jgi:adenylate cyclase
MVIATDTFNRTAAPPPPVRERTEAILVVDQVRSTARLAELGDHLALVENQALRALLREVTLEHGGRVNCWTGDGAVLRFRTSCDAVSAARRAFTSCVALDRLGDGIRLRAGLHVGPVLQGDVGAFGLALVVAVRLCDEAAPGELLLSGAAADRCGAWFGVAPRGPRALKGIPGLTEVAAPAW